jgi:hypothetical protein
LRKKFQILNSLSHSLRGGLNISIRYLRLIFQDN